MTTSINNDDTTQPTPNLPILPPTSLHVTPCHSFPGDPPADAPPSNEPPTPVDVRRTTSPLPNHQLTTRQLNAIPHILDGLSDSSVASRVGTTRESVNRWRNRHPAFIAELNRQRHLLHISTADRYTALLNQAMDVIKRYQSSDGDYSQNYLKAATTLLRSAPRRLFSPSSQTPPEPTTPEAILTQLLAAGLSPSPDDSPTDDAPPPPPPPPPTKKSRR